MNSNSFREKVAIFPLLERIRYFCQNISRNKCDSQKLNLAVDSLSGKYCRISKDTVGCLCVVL